MALSSPSIVLHNDQHAGLFDFLCYSRGTFAPAAAETRKARMVNGLATIPIELVNAIIDELPSNSVDIRNLRSVNKFIHCLATPRSFLCVRIADSLKSANALQSILSSPNIAPTVREIVYDERSCDSFALESIDVDRTYINHCYVGLKR